MSITEFKFIKSFSQAKQSIMISMKVLFLNVIDVHVLGIPCWLL